MTLPGEDSFLDIVSNIVGILIILVMVAGARAGAARPLDEASREQLIEAGRRLGTQRASVEAGYDDVFELEAMKKALARQIAIENSQRDEIARRLALAERAIQSRQAELSNEARQAAAIAAELASLRKQRLAVEQQTAALRNQSRQTVVVRNNPTPIGKIDDGDSIHLQLRAGRVAMVPFEALLELMARDMRSRWGNRHDLADFQGTVGPLGGFLGRYASGTEQGMLDGQPAVRRYMKMMMLEPTSPDLGQPIETALTDGSELDTYLDAHAPSRYSVAVWVYPDGFDDFYRLQAILHQRGYRVSQWPLDADGFIGASPHGHRAVTQ